MRREFVGVSIPPNTPLPTNEFFHVNTFAGGYDSRDAQEDLPPGSSPSMLDMEVTKDDRLIRAPGVTQTEILTHIPGQIILHPGFKYASELLFLKPPFIGVKTNGTTTWYDVGLRPGIQGYTNFAGVLLLSSGAGGIYSRQPKASAIEKILNAPSAFGLTVFAGRVVLGGTRVSGNMDFMGIGWSDATSDYKGWDIAQGAGSQVMIGSQRIADRFRAFAPNGFDTLAILNRRSIWIATPTGDVFQPLNIAPRIEGIGCVSAATVIPTEFGTLFLSDDGIRLFTGNDATVVSAQINADLVISENLKYSASFDPTRKRYYLHTPTETWVLDLLHHRWFRWAGVFTASIFFPTQGAAGTKWSEISGTWGEQTKAWWQFLNFESGGSMQFVRDTKLGHEDPASFHVYNLPLTPQWFDRRVVAENQDALMTALNTRLTYEASAPAEVQVWLPDKPNGDPELASSVNLVFGPATKRIQIPLIHSGRGISLGFKILSGSPRIRKASVEYQRTGMLWEGDSSTVFPIQTSDAILKPRLLYINSYDTGEQQSLLSGREFIRGGWAYQSTGGRRNGGFVLSIANTNPAGPLGGQGSWIRTFGGPLAQPAYGELESKVTKAGKQVAFNLFGKTLTAPMNCAGMLRESQFLFDFQLVLQILPDLRVRVVLGDLTTVVGTSDIRVPPAGWFALEWQTCISQFGNNKSGFVLVRLYTELLPPDGVSLISAIGVRTQYGLSSDTIMGYAWGTEVVRTNSRGISGIGIDDVAIYGHYGFTKRFLTDTFVEKLLPTSDSDKIESTVAFDGRHTYAEVGAVGAGSGLVGLSVTHGVSPRYKNLAGTITDIDSKIGEQLIPASFLLGEISPFTGIWLTGPFVPPPDEVIRNTFNEEATDLYQIEEPASDIDSIEGIAPFVLAGNRQINVHTGAVGPVSWNTASLNPHLGNSPNYPAFSSDRDINYLLRALIKLDGKIQLSRKYIAQRLLGTWGAFDGYTRSPDSVLVSDANDRPITRDKLLTVQAGVRGDRSILDAAILTTPNFYRDYVQFDLGQFGLEYAFHTRKSTAVGQAASPAVPGIVQYFGTNLSTGHLVIRDTSVDWNEIIVSRSIDWGDGSSPEASEESLPLDPGSSVVWPFLQHDYVISGTYIVTITVANSAGLISSDTLVITVPDRDPVANFSIGGVDLDLILTDASAGVLAVIVSWSWNFGDGSTSTDQNPTHSYESLGLYDITLVVTDSNGHTSSATRSVTVPLIISSDCSLSSVALADTPFVQGDDFNGGNPPLPPYANRAAFDAYYFDEDIFREAYDIPYAFFKDDINYTLDGVKIFNGHKTFKMSFGSIPAPPSGPYYPGAGWATTFTDDDNPELHYTIAPFGPTAQWVRLRLQAEVGVMSDSTIMAGDKEEGLELIAIEGSNITVGIYIRAGHVYVDVFHRIVDGGVFIFTTFDLGLDSIILGLAGFSDLLLRVDGDNTAHTIRTRIWLTAACELSGASPILDETLSAFVNSGSPSSVSRGLAFNFGLSFFNYNFIPQGALKNLWVADWETMPVSIASNPFEVVLE